MLNWYIDQNLLQGLGQIQFIVLSVQGKKVMDVSPWSLRITYSF